MNNQDLASMVAQACYEAIARALIVGFSKCELEGRPLNQLQQIDLTATALCCSDGVAKEVQGAFVFDGLLAQWAQDQKAGEAGE